MERPMSNITDSLAVISESTPHSETMPAMVDPPHPTYNPCSGCPRWNGMARITIGNITLDQVGKKIEWKGQPVTFTIGEFRILSRLALNHGREVSYRELYDVLKGVPGFIAGQGDRGHESNMRSAIKRIRRKFYAVDPEWNCIHNFTGFGYAWKQE
jgi:DNA-binding response OmpR family regulator